MLSLDVNRSTAVVFLDRSGGVKFGAQSSHVRPCDEVASWQVLPTALAERRAV
jgi:hypothetical protein